VFTTKVTRRLRFGSSGQAAVSQRNQLLINLCAVRVLCGGRLSFSITI
jgi:hypothetical protein